MSPELTKEVVNEERAGGSGWRRRPPAKAVFLGALLIILAIYTEMGFHMEWITAAGRIGPGFFPRIIGGAAVVLTLIALLQSMRVGSGEDDDAVDLEEDMGEGDLGHHPIPMLVVIGFSVVLGATLLSLGAIISGVVFMLAMLWYLNRGHLLTNILMSLGLPLAMYLLFQTFLNAGLPGGLLPRF